MSKRLIGIAAAVVVGTCCGATAASAEAPSIFHQVFEMSAPGQCGGHTFCNGTALDALTNEHLKIPDQHSLFGFNQNVSVQVLCRPEGDHSLAVVIAASPDRVAADDMAKNVHKHMSGAGCM